MHARQMPLLFSLSQHVKRVSSRSTCAIMRAAKFYFTSYVHSISTVLPGKQHPMCVSACVSVCAYMCLIMAGPLWWQLPQSGTMVRLASAWLKQDPAANQL